MYSIQWNVFSAFNPSLRSSRQPQHSTQGPTPDSELVPRSRTLTGDTPNMHNLKVWATWAPRENPPKHRENMHIERPCPSWESNPGLSCYEATVLTTKPLCHLNKTSRLTVHTRSASLRAGQQAPLLVCPFLIKYRTLCVCMCVGLC